jgi:hypothetical protein
MRGDACHVSLVKLLINPANWSANPLEQVRVEDIEKKSPFYNSLHFSPVRAVLYGPDIKKRRFFLTSFFFCGVRMSVLYQSDMSALVRLGQGCCILHNNDDGSF